jgi:hypothetical protein
MQAVVLLHGEIVSQGQHYRFLKDNVAYNKILCVGTVTVFIPERVICSM